MKTATLKIAALLFVSSLTVLSIAAVNAAPRKPVVPVKDDGVNRCNVNLWPGYSATPCRPPPGIEHYGDCLDLVKKSGWTASESSWYCSSVHFKS
jgi:hypothetical protein